MIRRDDFDGTLRMVRFNWSEYAAAGGVFLVSIAAQFVLRAVQLPIVIRGPLRMAAIGSAAAAGWWSIASIATGHLVYDRSPLQDWRWLTDLLAAPPERWANVTAGLDESSPRLAQILGGEGTIVDLFDPARMTEPSIRRARRHHPPAPTAVAATPDRLPFDDSELDAVFVIFAAHELRLASERRALFAELARVVRSGGGVVLVEHPRGLANLAAFGPGASHFFASGEWRRLGTGVGLALVAERQMTPFVTAFTLERP